VLTPGAGAIQKYFLGMISKREQLATILLIEDDHDDIATFSDLLYRVSTEVFFISIQDGLTAYKLLKTKECRPDFIFLDLSLPILNGVEFLELVNKECITHDVPIFVHSGQVDPNLNSVCKRLGVARFIEKSSNELMLLSTLRLCLKLRGYRQI
jgi:CheY-like chemotaxis protein